MTALLGSSCARLRVESEPEGAAVLWSPNGLDGWRAWPPRAWSAEPVEGEEPVAPMTPMGDWGRFGDTVWITVEKEGYYRPLPQLAQLYPLRTPKLEFQLVETPERYAERMRAEGLVFYGGQWVDPRAEGLVEFEGEWFPSDVAADKRQRAAGLVPFGDRWVTPEEYGRLEREEKLAQGYVEWKGRYVQPEVRDRELAIDEAVAAVGADPDVQRLDMAGVIGQIPLSAARVEVTNSSIERVRFLFSGPVSREIILEPLESYGLRPGQGNEGGAPGIVLEPGRYQIAVQPLGSPNPDFAGEGLSASAYLDQPFAGGFSYRLSFSGGVQIDWEDTGEYRLQEPEIPFEVPEGIPIPEYTPPAPPQRPGGFGPPGANGGGRRPGGGATGGAPSGGGGGGGQRPSGGAGGGRP